MERITVNPKISEETLIIEGERVFVEFLLEVLVTNMSEEEILETYPHFTPEELYACLIYATHPLKNESSSERFPVLSVS